MGSRHTHTCTKCPNGTALDNSVVQRWAIFNYSCYDCAKGTYSGQLGQSSCTSCSIGTYENNEGQTSCKECVLGQYGAYLGLSACEQCNFGYYQPTTAQTSCISCTYNVTENCPLSTSSKGASTSTDCVPGCGPGLYYKFVSGTEGTDDSCGLN